MIEVQSAEVAGGRLGAVLAAPRGSDPVLLGPDGPWLVTSRAHARRVLTEPSSFDFPGHVARGTDLSGSTAETRSGHQPFAVTGPEDVARGMAVFTAEWDRAVSRVPDGSPLDAMRLLRVPVARATCAAVLPDLDEADRMHLAYHVLAWIDALGPVIAAAHPPARWSHVRRRELRASNVLHDALAARPTASRTTASPAQLATMLAAGIQVPIAAGAWLLVWLADDPTRAADPELAVWETLRLTPPTWVTARIATHAVQLGASEIPAGALVLVSPLLLGRLPDVVPGTDSDRATFAPQRWASGEVRPGGWLPFGAGPHACPGRTLGLSMLRHLASWGATHPLVLERSVSVDQTRGIAPSPALVRPRTGGSTP